MPDVRIRFAPSPTGYLHVGGARTALFNWLFARHHGGKMLLRIEDTDRKRSTPEAVEAIFEGLRWLKLDWDEEPLFQSERLDDHKKVVDELMCKGAAYPCFCDPEELAQRQKEAQKLGGFWGYPGTCSHLSAEEVEAKIANGMEYAVRFRIPEGETVFDDAVHGHVEVQHREMEDFILMRRNGTPVYQVAVVADDLHMGITHVIRGDDHITNTHKQILIYRALGVTEPKFAHVPLILGPDKKRLSKRHGATSVVEYRQRGILPEVMRNFLALLGWSPGDDREIMDVDELIHAFSLEGINPSGAVFDEAKLEWMNGRYIMRLDDRQIWERIFPFLREFCQSEGIAEPDDDLGMKLANLFRERLRSFAEAPEKMAYFLMDPDSWDEKGLRKYWKPETGSQIRRLLNALVELKKWDRVALESCINGHSEELNVKRAALIHPLRLALTGGTSSPGIFDVMIILGREVCLRRIDAALSRWATDRSD